ncbi:MAG: hypothetical protein J2P46_16790 [Zavarzinella sp.]|nr:hypothetical protein [Zavarzinella sp.]
MLPRFAAATALLVVLSGNLWADDPDVPAPIKRAIKGGRDYLHAVYKPGGLPGAPLPVLPAAGAVSHTTGIGSAALAGLALLESGAPADDAAVANIARLVRQSGILNVTGTYEIALVIMFLDRLGAPQDVPVIQFLTLRLLSGQSADGAWSYNCDRIQFNPVEERQLWAELTKDAKLTTSEGDPDKPKKKGGPRQDLDDLPKSKDEPKKDPKPEEPKGLHPALKKLAGAVPVPPGFRPGPGSVAQWSGDHSNTQFATVGLWCGRRHDVDVTDALNLLEKHYRGCQSGDGGWSYTPAVGGGNSSPAMTCAGLMGLAIAFGGKNLPGPGRDRGGRPDPDALNKDPAVQAGLKYVGDFIAAAGLPRGPRIAPQPDDLSRNLYFMWSLERVGMAYGLTTIGKVDWYEWGSNVLVATQQRDGSWASDGFHSGSPENSTAFALLFLGRANLLEDLTAKLNGKVRDPGTSRLVRTGDLDSLLQKAGKPVDRSQGSGSKRTDSGKATQPRTDTAPAAARDPAVKLANALVDARAGELGALIEKYRDTKGSEYTDALARAAAKLTGEAQGQVREALAERLTRMKPGTLVAYMADPDRELRRAAALACGSKRKEQFAEVAEALIRLVADEDGSIAQAARASLKKLTDEDFGPEAGASAGDRLKALTAWRKWWDEHKK